MSSTYTSLHYHLVFSTKDRLPLINPEVRCRLYDYLGGTVRGLDAVPQGIGGVDDHVHLLAGLKPTICVSDFMRKLKKASSKWMVEHAGSQQFKWQEGYGAFTVSPTMRRQVQDYIARQEEHHRKRPFREELIELLRKAGVDFDERYLD